jgi:starch phosphorylase
MNEGHASLLALELLKEEANTQHAAPTDQAVIDAVCRKCVFTTHTPVAAGHDKFPLDLAASVLEAAVIEPFRAASGQKAICCDGMLNMTYLGFNLSHYINGVAKRHGEVSRQLFGDYPIDAITNGVHAATWVCLPMATLFDKRIPGWRADNFSLRYAISIDTSEIWQAHHEAKRALLDRANHEGNAGLDIDFLTIGFARRATAYKRHDLLLTDLDRLKRISREIGPIQLLFAGKAHPNDGPGKDLIRKVVNALNTLRPDVRGVYLSNYDMELCRLMVSGVDLWLNTPKPPMEASGTSGMKAALNGVPSLSILDGWWLEGCIEGFTGWSIGSRPVRTGEPDKPGGRRSDIAENDAESLYQKLEQVVVPMFYKQQTQYIDVMRHAIAINGSFFNTQRMMQHYATKAYMV